MCFRLATFAIIFNNKHDQHDRRLCINILPGTHHTESCKQHSDITIRSDVGSIMISINLYVIRVLLWPI